MLPFAVEAELESIQAIDAFDSSYPMEIIATNLEIQTLIKQNSNKFLIFPG